MLQYMINQCQIPIVEHHTPITDPTGFLAGVRNIQNSEGFVIAWNSGYRVKVKCEWYVTIHKAKENILREKGVIEMLLDEKSDDVKPFLIDEDRRRIEMYETDFWHGISATVATWKKTDELMRIRYRRDQRKEFALTDANTLDPYLKTSIFKAWDEPEYNWRDAVLTKVRQGLSSQSKVDDVRHLWGGAKWSMHYDNDEL